MSLESAGYAPVDRGGITFPLLSIDQSSYRPGLCLPPLFPLQRLISRVSWYFSSNGRPFQLAVAQPRFDWLRRARLWKRFHVQSDCSIEVYRDRLEARRIERTLIVRNDHLEEMAVFAPLGAAPSRRPSKIFKLPVIFFYGAGGNVIAVFHSAISHEEASRIQPDRPLAFLLLYLEQHAFRFRGF